MHPPLPTARLPAAVLAGWVLVLCSAGARADDLFGSRSDRGGLPQGSGDRNGSNPDAAAAPGHCAAYGAGFVAVPGTDGCVKVGGGVEVQFSASPRA